MSLAPFLMASALNRVVKQFESELPGFDVIDAHYFYPDGFAAVIRGRWLRKPVMITARVTNINLMPKYPWPKNGLFAPQHIVPW